MEFFTYQVIRSKGTNFEQVMQDLQKQVDKMTSCGMRPMGGVSIVVDSKDRFYVSQAVGRKELV